MSLKSGSLQRISVLLLLGFFTAPALANCEKISSSVDISAVSPEAWGTRYDGQRLQSAQNAEINAGNAATLELKWAYGFSSDEPRSYPLLTKDTLFIGDHGLGLVALDRETGCTRWENTSVDDISTAIIAAPMGDQLLLIFAERTGGVYAVNALDGKIRWHTTLEIAPKAMFSGSPLVHENRVFVPLSSQEIGLSLNPFYSCCKTSGGMAALDVATGELLWHRNTIEQVAQKTGEHLMFVDKYGPSGAPVWGAPTLDTQRDLLFFGTGQNYTDPATLTSDAIFALHAATGEVAWVNQYTANDTYNLACEVSENHPNCPETVGPDVDFGAPPVLVRQVDGADLVFAGQKSGDVYAMKAQTGERVWSQSIGDGGKLGGVHWGMAANPELGLLYVPISDVTDSDNLAQRKPGLFALNLADGKVQWSVQREAKCSEEECWTGLSAAIAAGPDIVVTGGLDGLLEVVDAATGKRLWSYQTGIEYSSVNAMETKGGAIDAHGPMLVDDLLIISSGYGSFLQEGGNALLVFSLP